MYPVATASRHSITAPRPQDFLSRFYIFTTLGNTEVGEWCCLSFYSFHLETTLDQDIVSAFFHLDDFEKRAAGLRLPVVA